MATLSITSTTTSSLKAKLSGLTQTTSDGGVWYYAVRWFIDGDDDGRDPSSGTSHQSSFSHTFSGLEPDTTYTITLSVYWEKYIDDELVLYGTNTDYEVEGTTDAETGGGARIYSSSTWKKATPYIYTSNGWKKATPYIYTSSGWKKCT